MQIELPLLIKKHTDTLVELTKTEPSEMTDFKLKEQMDSFDFNRPVNLKDTESRTDSNWLLPVPRFESSNSAFSITDQKNNFSISVSSQWEEDGKGTFDRLKEL